MAQFEAADSQVLAISSDPIDAKAAWGKSLGGISYPLVSDFWPHGQVAQEYGVFDAQRGRPDRALFVIDKQGIIRWARVYPPGVLPDNEELFGELSKLKG